jgi:hypothetical protein
MMKLKFATVSAKFEDPEYGTAPLFFTVKTSQLQKHERVAGTSLDPSLNAEPAVITVVELTETRKFPLIVKAGFAGLDCMVDNWSLTPESALDFTCWRSQ